MTKNMGWSAWELGCQQLQSSLGQLSIVYLMIVFLWPEGVGFLGARVAVKPLFCEKDESTTLISNQ